MSQSRPKTTGIKTTGIKTRHQRGFTLLEVLIACSVLAFGLLAVAGLMSQLNLTSSQSRASGIQVILASEKLEELNRYGTGDPALTPGGSLTVDDTASGYFDSIQISSGSGVSATGDISEIRLGTNGPGTYSEITHSPNGTIQSTQPTAGPPPVATNSLNFDRRWLIETNPVVNGVTINQARRITVWVQQTNATGAEAPFQASLVRPW